MSIATIVTRGYGSFGTIADVVRRGYGATAEVPPVVVVSHGAGSGRRKWTEDEIFAYVEALKDTFKKPEVPQVAEAVKEVRGEAVALIERVKEYREEKLEDLKPVRELLARIERQVQIYEDLKAKEEMELAEEEEAVQLLLMN